ncbi:DUF3027 domain-containing protein [[Micrococcus luteus] ATCC 49442]|uniref:DUF3027 domain-containing protein n=1 Tax=[Micrococcus luteus] ATCC 49442 TaxID=2698727 RepID=UPI0013D912D2|nr:DUF3027 domain-containing protein [[Micrococcus luteus] ATCC 49442]
MNQEAEQQGTTAAEQPSTSAPAPAAEQTAAKPAAKRRAGVPVWRTGKPDAFLAAAVDVARAAVEGITAPADIGAHIAAKSEGERLVTHLFESKLAGYQGWQWYAVLTRNSRSKVVTISELGLLPSEDSILSPEWVPWAERVRPEDARDAEEDQLPAADAEADTDADADAEADTDADADAARPADEDDVSAEPDPEEDEPASEAD